MIEKYQMYIGGEWVDSVSGETFESIDPYTGEALGGVSFGQRGGC